jgi:hypothetical protein
VTTTTSSHLRSSNGWHGGYVEVFEGKQAYLSVVFSWLLGMALSRSAELWGQGYQVHIGGPAAKFAGLQNGEWPALSRHNLDATVTHTGCVNKCGFCIIPTTEGDLQEKSTWQPNRLVCDNNITACSLRHFDRVIDSLKPVPDVDFNQGISAMALTDYQASRFAELDMKCIRLSWDHINYESKFMGGWEKLRRAGFPKSKITVYVLIGYNDTPADALYRLESVKKIGSMPFPMRYQPCGTKERNSFVGEGWTNQELIRYCRYWANLRITSKIPFADFQYRRRREDFVTV